MEMNEKERKSVYNLYGQICYQLSLRTLKQKISILCNSRGSLPFARWKILCDSARGLTSGEWCGILNERSIGGGVIVGEGRCLMSVRIISYGKGRSVV
jgi:hypothetical protein